MTDDTLTLWVGDELFWEPAIDSAGGGRLRARWRGDAARDRRQLPREARWRREAAQRVVGVTSVRQ